MAIKVINNTTSPNSLVFILLVFGIYSCITKFDTSTPTIIQCVAAIKNIMKKVQKVRSEKQMEDALN